MAGKRIVWFVVVMAGVTVQATSAKTIYVDDDANDLNNGSSWVDAYRYLQDALADARLADKPVEIKVAQGRYTPDRGAPDANVTTRPGTPPLTSLMTLVFSPAQRRDHQRRLRRHGGARSQRA